MTKAGLAGRAVGTGGRYVGSRWPGTAGGASGMRYGLGTSVTELTSKLYSHLPAYWWKGIKRKGNWSQTVTQETLLWRVSSLQEGKSNSFAQTLRLVTNNSSYARSNSDVVIHTWRNETIFYQMWCIYSFSFTWDRSCVTGQHDFIAPEGQKRAGMSQLSINPNPMDPLGSQTPALVNPAKISPPSPGPQYRGKTHTQISSVKLENTVVLDKQNQVLREQLWLQPIVIPTSADPTPRFPRRSQANSIYAL